VTKKTVYTDDVRLVSEAGNGCKALNLSARPHDQVLKPIHQAVDHRVLTTGQAFASAHW
jgi:hypothetical protein